MILCEDQTAEAAHGREASILGVLDWARSDLIVHTSPTTRSTGFIALLERLDPLYGPKPGAERARPVVLVLDNGPIHTSKATQAALATRESRLGNRTITLRPIALLSDKHD